LSTNRKLDEYDVFIRDERAAAILKKVLKQKEPSFEDLLTGDTPFAWQQTSQALGQASRVKAKSRSMRVRMLAGAAAQ